MKIVSRKELMAMPAGTLYHEWQPLCFRSLAIKDDTLENDWFRVIVPCLGGEHDSQIDALQDLDDGKSVPIDLEIAGRDGLFDDSLRYVVWEMEDAQKLYAKIADCLCAFDRKAAPKAP